MRPGRSDYTTSKRRVISEIGKLACPCFDLGERCIFHRASHSTQTEHLTYVLTAINSINHSADYSRRLASEPEFARIDELVEKLATAP
jgi:hypothetical protein